MRKFVLAFNGKPLATFDLGDLEPDEIAHLKALGNTRRFSFEPLVKDTMPQADRDPLDDIALDQLSGGYIPHDLKQQAERRVQERGLCR